MEYAPLYRFLPVFTIERTSQVSERTSSQTVWKRSIPGWFILPKMFTRNIEDQRRDEWETKIRPALKKISLSVLIKETGLSRRMLIKARTGRARPHRKNQDVIKRALRQLIARLGVFHHPVGLLIKSNADMTMKITT